MNRYDARENAFAVVFSTHFHNDLTMQEILDLYCQSKDIDATDEYFLKLVNTVYEQIESIDETIQEHLNNWTLRRISKVSLAALRLGTCELLYVDDTPDHVAINEAVELAKKYEDTKCSQFVNGVLSSVMKEK